MSTNRFRNRIPPESVLFAPMEGITDEPYRLAVQEAFPEWHYLSTDFLRIPSQGQYSDKKLLEHFGLHCLKNQKIKQKTAYQVLTTAKANTIPHIERLEELGVDHIDLNLGCPSKKVNGHKGGAYLLADLPSLRIVIKNIRDNFNGLFTAKIRVGYRNDDLFDEILFLLQEEGVEAVTIHGRTRDQLYEGRAKWSYIKRAVELLSIPVIGNGDCWTLADISNMFEETKCHGVMLGRGALKTPWMGTLFEEYKDSISSVNEEYLLFERKRYLDYYFYLLERNYRKVGVEDDKLLRRFKAFSRYLFDDYEEGEVVRSQFLRSRTLDEFKEKLENLQ